MDVTWGMKVRTTGSLRCSSECTARDELTARFDRTREENTYLLEGRIIASGGVPRLVPVHENGHPILGVSHASELHLDGAPCALLYA